MGICFICSKKDDFQNKYQKLKFLGSGATGNCQMCTYKNTSEYKNQKFAVKIVDKANLEKISISQESILTEVEILKTIDSPQIVNHIDVVDGIDNIQIVTEQCEEGELLDQILNKKNLTEAVVRKIMKQLLTGLNHLHAQNIIHRDVKLENIMIKSKSKDSDDIEIRIIDLGFGIKQEKQKFDEILGTPQYMAPEVISKASYSPETDIWSAGVCMFAMLSGKMPFHQSNRENISILFKRIKSNSVSFKAETFASCSTDAKDLIMKLLEKNPKDRIRIQDALKHPFFSSDKKDVPIDQTIIANLLQFKEQSTLVKAYRLFLARIMDSSTLKVSQLESIRAQFEAIDTDGSGEIDKDEFKKVFEMNSTITQDEIEAIFNMIDVRQNKVINQTEFLAGCINYKNQKQDEMLMMLFQEIDVDGSKSIEKEELKSQLIKQGYQTISEDYLDEKFTRQCKNKNHMTFDEFKKLHLDEMMV